MTVEQARALMDELKAVGDGAALCIKPNAGYHTYFYQDWEVAESESLQQAIRYHIEKFKSSKKKEQG
jgi:hypothetical protein